ncbi:MAG: DUF885 family protein [Alphaproteobacteria bacterium]|nr:DUF885 family protein [Alphaproteobacteria bacterium]MBV9694019.1 DUF885 family protein [Alphaproteobacteria bacterium]
MLDRRSVLLSGSAAITLATSRAARAAKPAAASEAAKMNKLFDAFMDEVIDQAPEFATNLGIDKGDRAYQKFMLGDRSLAQVEFFKRMNTDQLARLKTIDRKKLTGMDAVNYDVVLYGLQQQEDDNKRFQYGGGGVGAPYILSQLTGSYSQMPDFLDGQHAIETKDDADAYLARLSGFSTMLDEEREVAEHDVALGVTPPDFVLARALGQMTKLRGVAAEKSVMVDSVVRRTKAKSIAGDYAGVAARLVAQRVYPALDRQIAFLKNLQPKAVHDAGVWRLPDGDGYYAASLEAATTSSMKPEEIHQLGLDVVADHTAKIDAIMRAHGMSGGSVGERLRAMYQDPKFRYENTDAGKEKLIADLNVKVQAIRARLPAWFGVLPKADLQIKRVPKYTEEGATGGYYQNAALDGSRPGSYFINLRDTAEVPSWTLPTLTYHEGIPGHHLQISISQESPLPLIRKVGGFTAYVEGWALYAEQLAGEMGMYENDPWGQIGQLHDSMLRGVRLVADSGLHAKKWTREQAIKYFVDTLGDQEESARGEVERYCVWPGQACAYMVGKLSILKLRDKAKAALGAKFDIRKFHDAVLLSGAMPLDVLSQVVDQYIAANRTA